MITLTAHRIENKTSHTLILTRHYAHRLPCIQLAYGLFENNELVGCVTFGSPATPMIRRSMFGDNYREVYLLELNRLVIITQTENAASFLIGYALRSIAKNVALVSYADTGVGHVGYVYQATNWLFAGTSEPRICVGDGSAHSRWAYFAPTTETHIRSSKHRYWLCRDKRMRKICLWPSLPYPKGETTRHE